MTDLTAERFYFATRELCHRDVYRHLTMLRKSLLELKLTSKTALLENTLFWQQEVEKVKEEKDQEWLDRLNQAEAENKQLRKLIRSLTSSSTFTVNNNLQLCEAEDKLEKQSRQLDEKLIHINRLQLALAEQSKAMFELEKSYVLLHCRYKRATQKNGLGQRKCWQQSFEMDAGKPSPQTNID